MHDAPVKRPRRYLRSRITRKLILDTALHVFLKEGYSKTTISKISGQANVGYGTVYSHFRGKDDILNKVVDNVLDDFYTKTLIEFAPGSLSGAREIFYNLLSTCFQLADRHRPIMKVYQEALGQSDQISAHWQEMKENYIQGAAQSIRYAQEAGLAKKFDPQIGAKAYVLLIERFIWEVVNNNETDLERLSTVLTEMICQGFFIPTGKTQ
jgi:AcrR family transcriptional regulator